MASRTHATSIYEPLESCLISYTYFPHVLFMCYRGPPQFAILRYDGSAWRWGRRSWSTARRRQTCSYSDRIHWFP